MKHPFPSIITAAMIVLAGCSSKSAVSTADSGATTPVVPVVAAPVLGDINFEFDSSALSATAQEQLKQNAAWMQASTSQSVTIEGHCDERGTAEYNIALGEHRANSAKQFMISLGVSDAKISTISFGEERPLDPGHNEDAWAKNRRGHFVAK
jgi:peptidoglycan-associated lipoprotein